MGSKEGAQGVLDELWSDGRAGMRDSGGREKMERDENNEGGR